MNQKGSYGVQLHCLIIIADTEGCAGIMKTSSATSDDKVNSTTIFGPSLVQIMACRLVGTKPLAEPMLGYFLLDPLEQTSVKF